MSHIHFVTNSEAEKRVKQLGENPKYIFNVGNPGLDHLHHLCLFDKTQVENKLKFKFYKNNILVTYHPVTLDHRSPKHSFEELLQAIEMFGDELGVIFTGSNADTLGSELNEMIKEFIIRHKNAVMHTSLGQQLYFSVMNHVDAIVGNSSSGLLEAPSLHKPTVNIGDRQKGRLQPDSVINVDPYKQQIADAIRQAFSLDCSNIMNPYGDGLSAKQIVNILEEISHPRDLIKKEFYNLN